MLPHPTHGTAAQGKRALPLAGNAEIDNGQGPRILIIEREATTSRSLQKILNWEGYEVDVAADGPAGLACARRHRPALALVNPEIPGLSAPHFVVDLRALPGLDDVPVVLMPGKMYMPLAAGGASLLVQPFDHAELVAAVRSVLARTESIDDDPARTETASEDESWTPS